MTGLEEIRSLFATFYFTDADFVWRLHLVVIVGELPETYVLEARGQIGADDVSFVQEINKIRFDAMRDKPGMIEDIWTDLRVGFLKRLEQRQEECDSVLQR